ncbi:uncharacterized protein LOC144655059 [Oculina patagonica]
MKYHCSLHLLPVFLLWFHRNTVAEKECQPALGVESGSILDSQLTASSEYNSDHGASKARLRKTLGAGAWVAATSNNNQWLQIDLLNDDTKVTGIATQGRSSNDHWVTRYKLAYRNTGESLQFYREHGKNEDKEFDANTDRNTVVYYVLRPAIRARYIRFTVVTWSNTVAMRVELYDCFQEILDFCSNNAIGIASPDVIPDDHMTATSHFNEVFQPAYGRLYGDRGDGWCAKEPNRTDDWLQVDLGKTLQVCAVATQGDRGSEGIGAAHEWVTDFKLSYSADGNTWTTYKNGSGSEVEFHRYEDSTTVDRHKLEVPVSVRYVRFHPTQQHGWNCLRVEVYSVDKCQEALGMESGLISDDKLHASSEYNADQAANRGRLHIQFSGDKTGGWVAGTVDVNQWIQVDLGSQDTKVTRVATQGRSDYAYWVTNYTLQYSNNGVNFQNYREQGQNVDKEFDGNTDQDTVVYHVLNPPIIARYIRFRPVAWNGHISMRLELYGCLQDTCRSLNFKPPLDGHALKGHVIKNISLSVGMRSSCRGRCTMESKCVSFNIGPPINDQVLCQLSDSDDMRHPDDLKPREGFIYRGTENPCSSNPCFHNATCLNGFTYKKYRCVCQTGYRGENCEIVARTCKELYNHNLAEGNKAYPLKMGSVVLQVFCHMTDDLGECGGGGWTPVIKIDGQKEQAGFRGNRSTINQIFALRNILEQVNEWNAILYTHLIDFEKAFDSVHRESLSNIMSMYGIPEELIALVKVMYNNFECTVLDEGEKQNGFKSSQEVMSRTTEGRRTGIRWKFTSVLEDLDFADDIALLSSRYVDTRDKTSRLVDEAARVCLKVNAKKSKVMRVNARNDQRIEINGEQVDEVELSALLDK